MKLLAASTLARELMDSFGLQEWKFKFNGGKRIFGICYLNRKTICLSRYLVELNDEVEVKDTILHEIAHALAPYEGHSNVWKRKAAEIGCNPSRCYDDSIKQPEPKMKMECPNCGKKHNIYRKRKLRRACGECCRKYNNGKYDERFEYREVKNENKQIQQ